MVTHTLPKIEVVAYTAGLIDGEGSIYFSENRKHPNGGYFRVAVSQSGNNHGDELCEWLRDSWDIGHFRRQDTSFGECWHWHVDRINDIRLLLTTCLPYLRVKRKRAEEALAFLETWTGGKSKGNWTSAEDAVLLEHWREQDKRIAEILNNGRTEQAIMWRRRVVFKLSKPRGGF